ncbi:hypothetical protein [Acinetobacter gyllenbergii]|uniref:hypothetical protein n=1 Tax=Acinetobacter gyllenbergii TaxID=134534 RepID=UPI0003BEE0D5|nr:hypothetical protein [Acinetobacter gyllenbergii]ESK56799.1 hypothetical protein F987_00290 [Acinetobacter gyllenbergii NIPH 230]
MVYVALQVLLCPLYKLVKKQLYAIGTSKEWKANVSFSFQGVPIHGFICLRDPGSYAENPGLVVFRHGRVVQGLTSKKFMPLKLYKSHNKHEAQRVYGELIADDLPVTYTKDKFEIDEEAFGYELFKLQGVQELLKQSSTYRIDKGDVIHVANEHDITKKTSNQNPAEQNPSNQNPAEQNPSNQNPAEQNPSNQNPAEQNPSNQNPAEQNPTKIVTLLDAGSQSAIQLALLDDGNNDKKKLIKPEMLTKEIEAYNHCQELIKQINWIYINKKAFKEILIVALRNLLENYLDFTYGEAFPNGKSIKFEDRIKEMIDSIKPPSLLRDFEIIVRSLLNPTMQGFQTQNNIFNTSFDTVPRNRLIDTLHLSAHKGTNIVDLDNFILNYSKQYNMLLEILYCIAIYHKTLAKQQTAKQA